MRLILLFTRRWVLFYLPILLVSLGAIWLFAAVWMPLPPKVVTIATGNLQTNYASLAARYRDYLDTKGIRVDLANGSVNSVASTASANKIDDLAGFALGLKNSVTLAISANTKEKDNLEALAAIERHPVWVFTRLPALDSTTQLRGLRVGSAAVGTTTRKMAELLLAHAGLKVDDVLLLETEIKQGANDLIDGKIDAFIVVANSDSDVVRLLTRSPGIQLLGIDRVSALMAREPRLKPFVLPQGAIELRGDIPSRDLTMVAGNLHLIVNAGMHPALQRALIDAAYELHEAPTFLQRQGEFPSLRNLDFVATPATRAMASGQRPWMEQFLPYRWAQLAELLLYAVLTILLMTSMVLAWIPHFFEWRVNAILQNHYGELKFLETEIEPTASGRPLDIKKLLQRLDRMEQQVVALDLPDQFSNRWYTLRAHLADARKRLLDLRAR